MHQALGRFLFYSCHPEISLPGGRIRCLERHHTSCGIQHALNSPWKSEDTDDYLLITTAGLQCEHSIYVLTVYVLSNVIVLLETLYANTETHTSGIACVYTTFKTC